LNNPVTAFVNGRQRGGLILKAVSVSLVVDVVVAVALIPPFGAWGAVVANIAGQLVGIVWLAAAEPLALGQGVTAYVRLCRAFIFGCAIGAVALGVGLATRPTSSGLATVLACVVGVGLYLLVIRLTRSGLTSEDNTAVVGAIAAPARPYLAQLLRPITTERAV
jgi:peptidoglycan biosynthesis protein MviN/MurJ (putative lipid II flippase)